MFRSAIECAGFCAAFFGKQRTPRFTALLQATRYPITPGRSQRVKKHPQVSGLGPKHCGYSESGAAT
ncbi:MAG: hypothetical protein DCC68_05500 [Planctomycetota bacterium]|nr:MAG: hypothetical protein DCC68_05500 [Planctomycetota bacterium]